MKILIDLDDTFWDFMHPVLKHINTEHGLSIQKEDCKSWSYLYDNFDLNNPFACTECAEFWDEVKPFENAIEVVTQLVNDGHKVYFATASSFTDGLAPKIKHLLSLFDSNIIDDHNVIIAKDKGAIKGELLIDDGPHNLDSVHYCRTLRYYQPWNENYGWANSTAYNWHDVYRYIENIKQYY